MVSWSSLPILVKVRIASLREKSELPPERDIAASVAASPEKTYAMPVVDKSVVFRVSVSVEAGVARGMW